MKRNGFTIIEGGLGKELRRNERHSRNAMRSRRGKPRCSKRGRPAKGRFTYGYKEGHQVAGYETPKASQPSGSRRMRKVRCKREAPMWQTRADVPRELRVLDEAGRLEVWERGMQALREACMKEHIRWMESIVDGYYYSTLVRDGEPQWEDLGEEGP